MVYNRKFYDKQVIVAVNRQPDLSYSVPSLATSLPVGIYNDHLNGLLNGSTVTVRNTNGYNVLESFTLSPGEVNVWSYNPSHSQGTPRIGDIVSTMGREGNTVYIYGAGLDGDITVKFGNVEAQVVSNTIDFIETTVPAVTPGTRNITVSKSGVTSNAFRYNVLSGDQVQVNFKLSANTYLGESIYVVGSIPELGNWDSNEASEAMHNPNYPEWFLPISVPKNTTFEFKFIKKDTSGNVIWESGANRVFTSPSNSTGTIDTQLYYWRN